MTTTSGYLHQELPDQFIVFDSDATTICKTIMTNDIRNNELALSLKQNGISNRIIEVDATYEEVANNTIFMKTLLRYLGTVLSQDATKSTFRLELISDFD